MRTLRAAVFTYLALAIAAQAWAAQAPVTAADLSRLETTVEEIDRQATSLRTTDPTLATDVSRSLAELRDEVTYLRVKMRREGAVTRGEYASVRDRLETLRVRALGDKVSAQPVLGPSEIRGGGTIRVGTEFDVRLQSSLSSGTAKLEDRFEATTVVDYQSEGRVIVPAGSVVRGFVSSVSAANRLDRKGSLTLSFDEIRIDNTTYRLRASVTQALDGKVTEDAARIGAGAVVGAIIGGLIGGGKGALLGVLVGGGGTIAATEGTDVNLPAGTILRLRLDQALEVAAPATGARGETTPR
jgi:hypothetical protein